MDENPHCRFVRKSDLYRVQVHVFRLSRGRRQNSNDTAVRTLLCHSNKVLYCEVSPVTRFITSYLKLRSSVLGPDLGEERG